MKCLEDWDQVCHPKELGGLGIVDLSRLNKSLDGGHANSNLKSLGECSSTRSTTTTNCHQSLSPMLSILLLLLEGYFRVSELFHTFTLADVGNGESTSLCFKPVVSRLM